MAKFCVRLYIATVLIYMAISVYSGTGLGGYIMDLQLSWFGSASYKMTALFVFLAVILLHGGLLCFLPRTVANAIRNVVDDCFTKKETHKTTKRRLFIFSAVLALTPAALYPPLQIWLDHLRENENRTPATHIDAAAVGAVSAGTRVVVDGAAHLDLMYQLRSRNQSNYYVPITAPGADPSKGVAIILHTNNPPNETHTVLRGVVAPFDVPVYVKSAYRRAGIELNERHFMLWPEDSLIPPREYVFVGCMALCATGVLFMLLTPIVARKAAAA